jgi:hypothetical protein
VKILLYLFLAFSLASPALANENIFISEHFSITIPESMTINEKTATKVSLIFKGDEDLTQGTLTVLSNGSDNPNSLDTAWSRVRAAHTTATVLYEKEETFGGLNWKVIATTNESGCPPPIKTVLYFSKFNNVNYLMHYSCQQGNCDILKMAFNEVIASFQSKSEMK